MQINVMPFIKWILLLFVMMCSLNSPVFAQNYGLGFFSQETLKDHRTELILSTNKEFKFDRGFTLSFNLKLRPSLDSQYGYVLRVIQNDSANVDIVYNVNLNDTTWNFHLISGQHTTEMPFSINR